jgi:hypothetical protein
METVSVKQIKELEAQGAALAPDAAERARLREQLIWKNILRNCPRERPFSVIRGLDLI